MVTGNGALIPICSLSNRSLLPSLTVLSIYLETYFLKFDAPIGIFSKFLIFDLYAGLLRSLELRHQYMETQAFHDLIQEASLCNGSGTSHSTASSEAGSPFPYHSSSENEMSSAEATSTTILYSDECKIFCLLIFSSTFSLVLTTVDWIIRMMVLCLLSMHLAHFQENSDS